MSLASGLEGSAALTSRLKLRSATLAQARTTMDKGGAYATVIIPATLTRSLLLAAGVDTPGGSPPAQTKVELQENPRLGNLGVNLAAGVITPAIAQISPRVGKQISALASTKVRANPVIAAQIANPLVLATMTYRLLIYLSLASSGGTVPIQALPGFFNVVGHVEPLRNVLMGTRAILYFDAKGDAGLTHSLIVIAAELVFWATIGLAITSWYDRRKLDRISPDILSYVERAIDGAAERGAVEPGGS